MGWETAFTKEGNETSVYIEYQCMICKEKFSDRKDAEEHFAECFKIWCEDRLSEFGNGVWENQIEKDWNEE